MNGCSFPINDHSLNQDLAIRRFCPARVEQQQQQQGTSVGEQYCRVQDQEEDDTFYDHMSVLWSPTHHTSTCGTPPHLPTSVEVEEEEEEEEQFVDSFFNTDCFSPEEEHHRSLFDHNINTFQDNFSMSIDLIYKKDNINPSMIEGNYLEVSSSYEYTEALSEILLPDAAATTTTTTTTANLEETSQGVDQGLHLVHMLLACAEAVGCRDTRLADSMLTQMWSSVSPWGDSLQRVSYCFAMGLRSRLSLLYNNVNANGTFTNGAMNVSLITRQEKIEAFHLLHQTTPYIAFGFMAANDAIFQAAQGTDSLHIIDIGMEHTLQWPSFIRTLASRNIDLQGTTSSVRSPPIKLVRITGIIGDEDPMEIQSSMKTVIDEATSLGIPFEFSTLAGPATPSLLTSENLKLREGETLFVNSIMQLHKYVKESRGCLKTILEAIKKLGPTLVTVVEQDANHNGPFFLGRFLESLHYYSAIFDSLEASLPRNSSERMKIEKVQFAEEIRNIVACEGSDRMERHERWDQWRRQLRRGGFQMVGFKCWSEVKMKAFVNNYGCDGYTVASDKGCIRLGWKGRPIVLASAWQVHNIY
ncbi:hypothetical protein LguiA_016806 [Lonicera macranthoides]